MGERGSFDIVQAAVPSSSHLHINLGGRIQGPGTFEGVRRMTLEVIKNPLVSFYEGPDLRERLGEQWSQAEFGLLSSRVIKPISTSPLQHRPGGFCSSNLKAVTGLMLHLSTFQSFAVKRKYNSPPPHGNDPGLY